MSDRIYKVLFLIFVALPIERLDRLAIKQNVDEIGRLRVAPKWELP